MCPRPLVPDSVKIFIKIIPSRGRTGVSMLFSKAETQRGKLSTPSNANIPDSYFGPYYSSKGEQLWNKPSFLMGKGNMKRYSELIPYGHVSEVPAFEYDALSALTPWKDNAHTFGPMSRGILSTNSGN